MAWYTPACVLIRRGICTGLVLEGSDVWQNKLRMDKGNIDLVDTGSARSKTGNDSAHRRREGGLNALRLLPSDGVRPSIVSLCSLLSWIRTRWAPVFLLVQPYRMRPRYGMTERKRKIKEEWCQRVKRSRPLPVNHNHPAAFLLIPLVQVMLVDGCERPV